MTARGPRACRERGGAVVEMAMVVPLLVVLVMGIVDYAVLFHQGVGLRGGVREAAWNGGRGILGAPETAACRLTFDDVVPDDATRRLMCMAKHRSGLDPAEVRVMVRTVDLDDATGPGGYATGKGLMVCAMRAASSVTHFFSGVLDGGVQRSRLTSVILGADASAPTVGGGHETPLPGADRGWSFCDPATPAP